MSRRAWGAFAAVSVLWGIPYLFIKIADDGGMPPLVLAWGRVSLGAVVLLAGRLAGRHLAGPARARALARSPSRSSRSRSPSR